MQLEHLNHLCLQILYRWYSYFHSLMIYGIMFWGNSSHSMHVFRIYKQVIRIIMGSRPRDSCRELLKNLMILPLQLQYIFSPIPFVVKYKLNSENDSVNTTLNSNLYQLVSNKTTSQKWTYYFDIKIFNNLPSDIKKLSHSIKQFIFA